MGTLLSRRKVTGSEGIIVMNSIGAPHINQRTPAIIILLYILLLKIIILLHILIQMCINNGYQCEPPACSDEELSLTARTATSFLLRLSGSRKIPSSGPRETNQHQVMSWIELRHP